MMKKTIKTYVKVLGLAVAILGVSACSDDFLQENPKGSLDENTLATAEGVDGLLIAAYSMLDGTANMGYGWEAATSNWVFGSIRGMEANKGSDSGDQPDINPIQTFTETPTNPYLDIKWRSIYDAISRTNSAVRVANSALAAGSITDEQHTSFVNQARALRGFFHFEAWRMWNGMIPYVNEETDLSAVTNTADVRAEIIADLTAGTNLPNDMGQIGRFNGTVSRVLLAKALMQMNGDYAAAAPLLQQVVTSGTQPNGGEIGLLDNYGDIFDIEFRNDIEAIYTVQYSVNDGSGGWNAGQGEVLNYPYKGGASPGGCCGFFQPTQEFVNSFRTENGLPLLDNSYNNDPVLNDVGLAPDDNSYVEDPGPLDPRLDWTVGRRGIPYLDWGIHTGQDWVRLQSYGGPFSPKKQVYKKSQEGVFTEVGNWTSGWTANGYRLIRYADVLLLLAECQARTNSGDLGLALVNQVRARAANPDSWVKEDDGVTNAANYQISTYASFSGQEMALDAILMERKLELGMEGHRVFDLLRFGDATAVSELQRIIAYETPLRPVTYNNASVSSVADVYYPIPQRQIDLMRGNLEQN
jgi:hypothetical protein